MHLVRHFYRKGEVNRSSLDLDMKRLLSMDYQREWLLNKSIEESKEAEHKQVRITITHDWLSRVCKHSIAGSTSFPGIREMDGDEVVAGYSLVPLESISCILGPL